MKDDEQWERFKAVYEATDPEQLLELALLVVRSSIVHIGWEDFVSLPPAFQEALAVAGDIIEGRRSHPDEVVSLLASGVGDPDRERRR